MPIPGMPAGCLGPSDIDHYYALGYREDCCPKCETDPCECCRDCGAGPDEACERSCGLTCEDVDEDVTDANYLYWAEKSELFCPPTVIHGVGD